MRSVGGRKARACSRPGTRLRLFWTGAFRGVGEEKCEVPPKMASGGDETSPASMARVTAGTKRSLIRQREQRVYPQMRCGCAAGCAAGSPEQRARPGNSPRSPGPRWRLGRREAPSRLDCRRS
jgi:hypothetical protein